MKIACDSQYCAIDGMVCNHTVRISDGIGRSAKSRKPHHDLELGSSTVLGGGLVAVKEHIDSNITLKGFAVECGEVSGLGYGVAHAVSPMEIEVDLLHLVKRHRQDIFDLNIWEGVDRLSLGTGIELPGHRPVRCCGLGRVGLIIESGDLEVVREGYFETGLKQWTYIHAQSTTRRVGYTPLVGIDCEIDQRCSRRAINDRNVDIQKAGED